MTPRPFQPHFVRAGELREFHARDEGNMQKWAMVRRDQRRPGYLTALRDQSWAALAATARSELKARRSDIAEMTSSQERILTLIPRMEAMTAAVKVFGASLTDRDDWPSLRRRAKQQLVSHGIAARRADQILARYGSTGDREIRRMATHGFEGVIQQLDGLAKVQLTAIMGATLALAVARFNQYVVAGVALPADSRGFCDKAVAELAALEIGIWKALRASELPLAGAYANKLSRVSAVLLMDSTISSAAALAAKRHGAPELRQDGALAVRFGDLIRALLRAIALGHHVSWFTRWPMSEALARDWIRAAVDLPFPRKIRLQPLARIAALAGRPALSNGKAITIEGVLGPVTIVHRGTKAISFASVMDQNGRSVTIAIPYIKLDSGGMVPGSYARLSGTWQKASKEVRGPALLIDRLNFAELGAESWRDWVSAQLRQIFEPSPHGLAASWSWEPGSNGAGNPLRYGVWFGR